MRVCTVQEMRECDRVAAEAYGLATEILMENAGHAVFNVLRREFSLADRRFLVVCGGGNNGGDGLVAARLLLAAGADVRVALLVDESSFRGAARANLRAAQACGVPVQMTHSAAELPLGRSTDVVIDAIFGTGLSRSPEGLHREVIERLNRSAAPVVAVDVPSGVDGNTGAAPGAAVRAVCTVALGLPKQGNLLPPGRELCGRLYVSHISLPPALCHSVGGAIVAELAPLPPRPLESHKGAYGDVLLVAGARSYLGAPLLASMAFLRAGGGYARLAAPQSLCSVLGANASEVVLVPLSETSEGTVARANRDALLAIGGRADMAVVGPGLSLHPETQQLVRDFIAAVPVPVVIDADGLSAVASEPDCVLGRTAPSVLTPHVGEMARLLRCTVEEVVRDRVAAVTEAARRFKAVVLLKGSSTLVAAEGAPVVVNLSGNPGMATAGCGDVLAGTIAAMYGMGLDVRMAAAVGAFVHGLAGDMAAAELGQDGIIARDVLEHLPGAVRDYRDRFSELMGNHCGRLSVI